MLMSDWKQSGCKRGSVIQKNRSIIQVHPPWSLSCGNHIGQSAHFSLYYFQAILNNNQLDQSNRLSQSTIFVLKRIFVLLEETKIDQEASFS